MKDGPPVIVNVGLGEFAAAMAGGGVSCIDVDWRPPAQGDPELVDMLFRLAAGFRDPAGVSRIELANREALRRILAVRPVLRRVRPAREVVDFGDADVLHAGPPIEPAAMCSPMRGAIVGALQLEGLAASGAEAEARFASGRVCCRPTASRGVVAPMAGVVSPSMPLFVVEDAVTGRQAFSPLNEGVGHVLRFGANNPRVIDHLRWMATTLAPALDRAVTVTDGIELRPIISQALLMGDELHQRNVAASLAFHKAAAEGLIAAAEGERDLTAIVSFLVRDIEQFLLNLAMAAAKCALDAARNIPYCSVVTAMSRNGVDFGLTVSALGDEWLTAPSLLPRGLYFPGYSESDANPDMGDSAIIECYGLGGFAMAAAPTVARFVGAGTLGEALEFSLDMENICVGANPDFALPTLDFAGAPTGIDLIRVVATGILPVINSGVAHRLAGVGQVGAGLATPPMEVMTKALRRLYASLTAQT